MKMCRFELEVFCDNPNDESVLRVINIAEHLVETDLAPHIDWHITISPIAGANRLPWAGIGMLHYSSRSGVQTITITPQVLMFDQRRLAGLTLSEHGAIDLEMLKISDYPEDVLINEWLHTISNQKINGRFVGNSDVGNIGTPPRFHDKYKRMLRWEKNAN